DSESKGEPSGNVGVDAAVPEDLRVNHAAAEHLEETSALADATRLARAVRLRAEDAADIHLGARFDEREVARSEAHGHLVAVEAMDERGQYALQLGEGDVARHVEALDLMEHRRVRHV